jgi:hypothetical protein
VVDIENLREIYLDGTRIPLREYAKYSLSKGLSAPIGSVLVGDEKRGVLALAISRRKDDTDIWVRG